MLNSVLQEFNSTLTGIHCLPTIAQNHFLSSKDLVAEITVLISIIA